MKNAKLGWLILMVGCLSIIVFPQMSDARPRFPHPHIWFHPWFPFWVSPRVVIVHGDYGYLDLDVAPEEAEVYINGDRLGICDEFDGFPDYLYLKSGPYTITFKLGGYQDYTEEIVVHVGKELEFNTRLQKVTSASRQKATQSSKEIEPPAPPPEQPSQAEEKSSDTAMVHFRIFPKEASIYIDGIFAGVAHRLNTQEHGIEISVGQHTIEILMPGHEPVVQEIEVTAGETKQIRAILTKLAGKTEV